MNPEIFFDNFGMLADTPNGVQKLRELILQLAVQGKLVPQDPNDEPAAVLLERIKAEKERLIRAKKIRKPKPLSLNDFENSYELPVNWKWTRLFDIGVINPRNEAKDDMDASFIPMALISETYSTPVSSERRPWGKIKTGFTHFAEEDVVLAKITPCFQNGKSAVMRGLLNGLGAGTTELHVFRPLLNESANPDYVLLYLRSPQFLTEGIERMTGTAGQKRVPRDYFAGNPFPLPPFQEQRRIVAKVDQLMVLCDELEARQQQKQEARLRLNNVVLDRLLTAHEPDEFAHHWQRICDNFDLLYGAPETVGELRKAILQLAVQGKLVPQDSNDEPAAVLLEKIKAEKERLVKEKKIKKVKQLPDFEDGELPYELPNEWLWTRIDQIANSVHYGYTASANHELKDIRLLRITDIQNGRVNWNNVPGCEIDEKIVENYRLYEGDLLIARTGGTIGKSYLVEKPTLCAVFASYIIRVIPNSQLFPNYLKIFLESPLYWKQLYEKSMGTGQPNVNGTSLRALILPLPPLQEQRRIIAKVDQLMALCDELEAKIKQSQTDGEKLMDAVMHQLVTT